MPSEPISPELALVDPELDARARAALPDRVQPPRLMPPSSVSPDATASREHRSYPFWARATAAAWLVVLGILIGGAAIPHAQDKPRVVPKDEDSRFCEAPPERVTPTIPRQPGA